jgi:hypothetical protein
VLPSKLAQTHSVMFKTAALLCFMWWMPARAEDPAAAPAAAPAATAPVEPQAAVQPAPQAAAAPAPAPAPAEPQATAQPAAQTAAAAAPAPEPEPAKPDVPQVDFQSEDTFIDVTDALRSKQFVQRAILSSAIQETSKFGLSKSYLAPLIGYDAIFQPANRGPFTKFASGSITIAYGYITQGSNDYEIGVDLSAVSNLFLDYKYIFRPRNYSFWPFLGGGLGFAIDALNLTASPPAAVAYTGGGTDFFMTLGVLVPLVDVGLRAEAKFQFYGLSRLVLSTGIGVNFFL